MWKAIHSSIHSATASICQDITQPAELKEPNPIRRWARLVPIAVAGVVLTIGIVVMTMRIPKLQSEKRVLGRNSTDEVANLLRDAVEHGRTINCPCRDQVMSWCEVTTFHIMRGPKGASNSTFTEIVDFTKDDGRNYVMTICKNSKNPLKETICQHTLSPVLDNQDSRTYLPTASAFISPPVLYKEIATRIDTVVYEQSNAFYFLFDSNKTAEYNYSLALANILRRMKEQFLKNSSSSPEDYWKASKGFRREYNVSFSYGMNVSWDMYLQICKPAVCDVEFEVSLLTRVTRTMSQVGGMASILALVLKFLLWPLLRFALRFPTSK